MILYLIMKTALKKEKDITTLWLKKMAETDPTFLAYKIPDVGNSLKPFDLIGTRKNKCFVCEIKLVEKEHVLINDIISKCSPHQLLSLQKYKSRWADAYLLWYSNVSEKFYFFQY